MGRGSNPSTFCFLHKLSLIIHEFCSTWSLQGSCALVSGDWTVSTCSLSKPQNGRSTKNPMQLPIFWGTGSLFLMPYKTLKGLGEAVLLAGRWESPILNLAETVCKQTQHCWGSPGHNQSCAPVGFGGGGGGIYRFNYPLFFLSLRVPGTEPSVDTSSVHIHMWDQVIKPA